MSNNDWPVVALGDLVDHRKEFVRIDDFLTYRRCRVRLHAQGIVMRDEVEGSVIKTKAQQICRTDEFLVAEIDAKMGGFGIVPPELDGAIVSSHYFLFKLKADRLNKSFLGYFSRTPKFREQVTSRGTTNYAAIRPSHVLGYTIPLPPLNEQQRIVDRLDRIEGMIQEAQALRLHTNEKRQQLCRAILRDQRSGSIIPTPMRELVAWRRPNIQVVAAGVYPFAGVYCFGRGVFPSQIRTGMEFAYKQLTQIHSGEFVYPKLMAWEGALAVVPTECDGLFVSPEFPVFKVNEDRVLPEVLDVYFRSPAVWPSLSGSSTGTNVRRKRLNPKDFLEYEFPLPAREVQFKLRAVSKKMNELLPLQNKLSQLDAMFPSILDRAFKGAL
jgi:type I restriction enzyme S subunit